jgi:cysteine synthase
MPELGLEREVVDEQVLERTVGRFREAGIRLPTFAELAEPQRIPEEIRRALADVDPDAPHPLNLFRVHWYQAADRRSFAAVPQHLVLPRSLTGIESPVVLLLGNRFPMIRAHKVLAAYGCLVARVVTGQFDPTRHLALWPSTGNYCRGGVAISRLMKCRGVAILPEGMSRERFDWLERWVADPADIIRTPGSESNVKEIYDACAALDKDPNNIIFNQFCEFGNHLVHALCTGRALEHVFEHLKLDRPALRLAAFVSATGSAGTIGAGDPLKQRYGTRITAVEALECPTLLYNGYGEHNIQGIGDKHVPLIHNVMNTDVVAGVSDRATDQLAVLFGSDAGRSYLAERRGVPAEVIAQLADLGLSSIGNLLGAIQTAKLLGLGPDDVVLSVATDGGEMYASERERILERDFAGGFDQVSAAEVFGQHLLGASVAHTPELTRADRERIFNLGYYTWVEQQGVALRDFDARRDQAYWRGLREMIPVWDRLIDDFNERTGLAKSR